MIIIFCCKTSQFLISPRTRQNFQSLTSSSLRRPVWLRQIGSVRVSCMRYSQLIAGRKANKAWLDRVIDTVGLAPRLKHRPSELSGGQQQRVAVARALAGQPEIIFGDEPTGNLDSRSGAEVLGFLRRSVDELGQTFVMVTHDPSAAAYADRVLFLADGRIVDDMGAPTADKVLDRMRQFDSLGHAAHDQNLRGDAAGQQR